MIQWFDKLYKVYKACVNYHCNDGLTEWKQSTHVYIYDGVQNEMENRVRAGIYNGTQKRNVTEYTQEYMMEYEMQQKQSVDICIKQCSNNMKTNWNVLT